MMTTETKMKLIVFSPAMAQAIFEGRKTQTRRVMKPQPHNDHGGLEWADSKSGIKMPIDSADDYAPHQPGDVLRIVLIKEVFGYRPKWRGLFIRVNAVRCERVQDISEEDVIAEGIAGDTYLKELDSVASDHRSARIYFMELWNSLHGAGAWQRNDWVWVYEFERISKPTLAV